ncbi:MAG: SpoIIE family protein phosphatase [Desulfomonilaceae bacterium]
MLSVIDCTGHGVPGAIMTMIAASALNRATHELGYRDPAATIRRVNELVRNTLERRLEGPLYDDGLDIGTCYVNRTNREIVFAGARISLFCADDKTATEIKGDRQSVGYRSSDPGYMFTNHHVQFPTGADLYLMTDGLIEQVGGPLKLPLGKNRLIKFIVENQGRSPDEQRTLLNNLLMNYRRTEDQRDDITVVRFRI